MTLSATTAVNRYAAAVGQTVFPYSFKVLDDAHIEVYEGDTQVTSGFTVSGVGSPTGGNVTFAEAPRDVGASAVTITLKRSVPLDQVVDLPAQGALSSVSLEESGLDRIVMQLQQLDEEKQRAVLLAVSSTLTGLTISPEAGTLIGWNSAANALINYASAAIGPGVVPTSYMEGFLGAASGSEVLDLLGVSGLPPASSEAGRVPLASGAGTFVLADPLFDLNVLVNPAMRIWPQGASFSNVTTPANDDDTYTAEGWILLSEANDVASVTKIADSTTAENALRLEVVTTGSKFGICQIVENADIAPLMRSGECSLSFEARIVGSSIDSVKAAVLAWDGTADSVASDLVSGWSTTGNDPTPSSNWAFKNAPSVLSVDTAWQSFKIEGIALDTVGAANIAVFIWVDQTDADVGDIIDVRRLKLQPGAHATIFREPDVASDMHRCRRYFQRYSDAGHGMSGTCRGATTGVGIFHLDTPMRVVPTMGYSTATALNCIDDSGGGTTSSAISLNAASVNAAIFNVTIGSANFTDGHGLMAEIRAGEYLEFSARL